MAVVLHTDGNVLARIGDSRDSVMLPDHASGLIGAVEALRHAQKMMIVVQDTEAVYKPDLIEKIKSAAVRNQARSISLIGNPSADDGDIHDFAKQVKTETRLRTYAIEIDENDKYDEGIIRAYRASGYKPVFGYGFYGLTSLDYCFQEQEEIIWYYLGNSRATDDKLNQAFSVSGYEAAGGNIAPFERLISKEMQLRITKEFGFDKRILIVGEQIYSNALRTVIRQLHRNVKIVVADFFKMIPSLEKIDDVHLGDVNDFISLVSDIKPTLIIGDPVLKELLPDYRCHWIERTHYALSGGLLRLSKAG